MDESALMDKYKLSRQNLQLVFQKLHQAGLLEPSPAEGPIPEDHALVPVEKKARDVPRDSGERRRRLRRLREEQRAREESERLLKIFESTVHWWLLGVGLVTFLTGTALYLMWPYLDSLWFGDLALDRALGLHGSTQHTYELWHRLSTGGGPIMALAGGLLAVVGLVKLWLNKRKLEKLIERQRQGLVFSASREK
jgi:hypothetical protein